MKRDIVRFLMLFLVPDILLTLLPVSLAAQIQFAGIFSDHMVLQAQKPVSIWGNASSGEQVHIFLNGQQKTAKTDRLGKWSLVFPAMNYGDTVCLKAVGKTNEVALSDIWSVMFGFVRGNPIWL